MGLNSWDSIVGFYMILWVNIPKCSIDNSMIPYSCISVGSGSRFTLFGTVQWPPPLRTPDPVNPVDWRKSSSPSSTRDFFLFENKHIYPLLPRTRNVFPSLRNLLFTHTFFRIY